MLIDEEKRKEKLEGEERMRNVCALLK